MTSPPSTVSSRPWTTFLRSVPAVWCAFALVHVALLLIANQNGPGFFGDPHLYGWWVLRGLHFGEWPVLTDDSVYPLGALIPMTLPAIAAPEWTQDFEAYRVAYTLLVVLMNGLAIGALLRAGRCLPDADPDSSTPAEESAPREIRTLGAWWWLLFLLCLGPISLTRLDGISAALTVIALAQLIGSRRFPGGRTALGAGLATFGAWIKIAPGAAWLAMAVTSRRPWRQAGIPALIVTGALVVPAGIIILATGGGFGGLGRIFSFLGEQGSRGLQSESAGATFFSTARLWGSEHVVQLNEELKTWEIAGPGTATMSKLLGILLVVAVVAIAAATWLAARRVRATMPDEDDQRTPILELILFATLALTLALFVFNKVGSPQFVAWFAPPVAVALTTLRPKDSRVVAWRSWLVVAGALLVVGLLTHQLFPAWYEDFINGYEPAVVIAALRNAILVVLGGWTVIRLLRWRGPAARSAIPVHSTMPSNSVETP